MQRLAVWLPTILVSVAVFLFINPSNPMRIQRGCGISMKRPATPSLSTLPATDIIRFCRTGCFSPSGYYSGAVDLTDPDAKLNFAYTIGNGWNALTIDAHVKLTSFSPDESPMVERYRYYASNPAYYLTIFPDGRICAGVYQANGAYTNLTTDPVITLNLWYAIQMTWTSGGALKVFVNGVLMRSVPSAVGSIRDSTHPLTVGWFHDTHYGDFYLNGGMDEVRISDIDRSEPPSGGPVQFTLTPISPPIVVPPNGGGFSFNVAMENLSLYSQLFDVWCSVEVPGGRSS